MGLLVSSPVAVKRAMDEPCTGCALSLLTGNYIGWYSQWPAQCFSGRDKKGAQVSWISVLCSSFTSFNNREILFSWFAVVVILHICLYRFTVLAFFSVSIAFQPNKWDFHWESNRKIKVASVAKYPISVRAETSPLAVVGQGTMNMTWKGQIPWGLCRGLFTWSIIH